MPSRTVGVEEHARRARLLKPLLDIAPDLRVVHIASLVREVRSQCAIRFILHIPDDTCQDTPITSPRRQKAMRCFGRDIQTAYLTGWCNKRLKLIAHGTAEQEMARPRSRSLKDSER